MYRKRDGYIFSAHGARLKKHGKSLELHSRQKLFIEEVFSSMGEAGKSDAYLQ